MNFGSCRKTEKLHHLSPMRQVGRLALHKKLPQFFCLPIGKTFVRGLKNENSQNHIKIAKNPQNRQEIDTGFTLGMSRSIFWGKN